ncbi:hypothetical protein KC217_21365, partial [Mycobacterium tuberculosis]|nr:hypothetical protein [Mycobacterium tuberculosis]
IHLGHTDVCRDETGAARNPVHEAVTVNTILKCVLSIKGREQNLVKKIKFTHFKDKELNWYKVSKND